MHIALKETQLGLRNSTTRLPFRYGKACLTRCPQAVFRAVIEVDGHAQAGFSGDCLPPSWFDKMPGKTFDQQIKDMLWVIAAADASYRVELAQPSPFFPAWRAAWEQVHAASAARGEQRDGREQSIHAARARIQRKCTQRPVRARKPRLPRGEQVHGTVILEQLDPGMRVHPREQGILDLAAGGVRAVQDPATRVPALSAEREVAARVRLTVPIELDPVFEQSLDRGGPALDDEAHDRLVAESGARHQSVLDVPLEGVVAPLDRGDAPLRPIRRGVRRTLLGDDADPPDFGGAQREEEPRDAAPDDQEVEFAKFDRVRRHVASGVGAQARSARGASHFGGRRVTREKRPRKAAGALCGGAGGKQGRESIGL